MGVWTAITATTNPAHLVSTTAATIGLVDIHAMYAALPPRHCKNASWLMHSNYSLVVKALGTAISVSCSMDITQAPSDRLLGKKLYKSDDSPSTQTTTALDPELLLGDFSRYIMVDRIGMTAELVAHLVGTNHRPTGQRGLSARWRSGGAVVDTRASGSSRTRRRPRSTSAASFLVARRSGGLGGTGLLLLLGAAPWRRASE